MKYVINDAYGGFELPHPVAKTLGASRYDDSDEIRTNPILIDWVEHHPNGTELKVVEIPDNATDWELREYDGWENIIAVVDGKLIHP